MTHPFASHPLYRGLNQRMLLKGIYDAVENYKVSSNSGNQTNIIICKIAFISTLMDFQNFYPDSYAQLRRDLKQVLKDRGLGFLWDLATMSLFQEKVVLELG